MHNPELLLQLGHEWSVADIQADEKFFAEVIFPGFLALDGGKGSRTLDTLMEAMVLPPKLASNNPAQFTNGLVSARHLLEKIASPADKLAA